MDLRARVKQLERELRIHRLAVPVALVVAAGCAAASDRATVEAQHFVVRAPAGRKAAELGLLTLFTRPNNLTRATLYDPRGVPKVWLNVGPRSQPAVTVFDEKKGRPVQFPDPGR